MSRRIDPDWLHSAATRKVMDAFQVGSRRAYFVGGCVRDALLGVKGQDIDIATEATPTETQAIAKAAGLRPIPTGIDHGTITIVADGTAFEITSFRKDVETDGRRAVVAFSTDIKDDARRRDFTMNALYADAEGQVLDPLNGLGDLDSRRVRFIEDAGQRIAEDYLRILRFFRFYAWYGDPVEGLDAEGLAACTAGADGLDMLSRERVGTEMTKLLSAPDPAPAVAAMAQSGVLARLLPGTTAEFLATLVHLEEQAQIPMRWVRRLAILGGEDPTQELRMSKQDSRYFTILRSHLADATPTAQAAFLDGQDAAIDTELLRAASLGAPVPENALAEAARGAEATFPVSAADLQPDFQGKALGDRLKQLQQDWFLSGLSASRDELLN